MARKKKEMDKLSREVAQALAANMSYGKWKAMQEPVKPEEKPIPEGWRKCEYCGEIFKHKNGKRFCDLTCREKGYKPRRIQTDQERYRQRKGL